MAHFMPELPSHITAPLCSILLIFILDWRMGLASLITVPLGGLFFAAMMRGYASRMENYMCSANEMNSSLVEYVNGIQVIKAFNRGGKGILRLYKHEWDRGRHCHQQWQGHGGRGLGFIGYTQVF